MAAAVALVGIASVPMLVIVNGVATWVVVQFWNDVVVGGGAWANAAGAARTKPARPAQASKPGWRIDLKQTLMPVPKNKESKQKKVL
jgi:hypothetical protein